MNKKLPKLLALLLSFIIIVSNPMSSLASTELDTEVPAPEIRVTSPDSDAAYNQIKDSDNQETATENQCSTQCGSIRYRTRKIRLLDNFSFF